MTIVNLSLYRALKQNNKEKIEALLILTKENEQLRLKITKLEQELEVLTKTLDGYKNVKAKEEK
jgi:hypothetical protein